VSRSTPPPSKIKIKMAVEITVSHTLVFFYNVFEIFHTKQCLLKQSRRKQNIQSINKFSLIFSNFSALNNKVNMNTMETLRDTKVMSIVYIC
jgi:hypothetical protein